MRVKIIKQHCLDRHLTVGKVYETVGRLDQQGDVRILNDLNKIELVFRYCFEVVLEDWTPKRGEMVECSDIKLDWYKQEFVTHVDGIIYPYVVLNGGKSIISYKHVRQINPIVNEIAELEDIIKELKKKL